MTQPPKISFFETPANGELSTEMLNAFDKDGVIVLRGFVDPEKCETLRKRSVDLVSAHDPGGVRSVFSTTSNDQLNDEYFIESGGDIRFFYESGAFDDQGKLRQVKENSLNKIGHAMHDLDPVFDDFSRTPKLAATAKSLGFKDPNIVQSMYIFKPPGIGGEVICHQDSTYIYSEPETCIGFWFAIDEATAENGCMEFLPGAHKGPLRKRNRRSAGGGLVTENLDQTPFPDHLKAAAPANRGDLVIFHGRAPHMSGPNTSTRSRHAYTLHVVDGVARWPAENWLQRPANLPFRGFE